MSRKSSGGSWIFFAFSLVVLGVAFYLSKGQLPWDRKAAPPPPPAPEPAVAPAPKLWASLSRFTVNKTRGRFTFKVELENNQPAERTVYAVVYGNNDAMTPPRRSAWPDPDPLFVQAGTQRGLLSPADISKDWEARPENTKGMKVALKPNRSESINGWLPMDETCPHKPWEGKPLDPERNYNEISLWVFSDTGGLVSSNTFMLNLK